MGIFPFLDNIFENFHRYDPSLTCKSVYLLTNFATQGKSWIFDILSMKLFQNKIFHYFEGKCFNSFIYLIEDIMDKKERDVYEQLFATGVFSYINQYILTYDLPSNEKLLKVTLKIIYNFLSSYIDFKLNIDSNFAQLFELYRKIVYGIAKIMRKYIIFDLDGTLINSIPDMTREVNLFLSRHNGRNLTEQEIISIIGSGAKVLVKKAFELTSIKTTDSEFDNLFSEWLDQYGKADMFLTKTWDGVIETLEYLKKNNYSIN